MVSADCQKTWQRPAKVSKWAERHRSICVGRGLLASSHAGTRLPIAAVFRFRALPLNRPLLYRGGMFFRQTLLFDVFRRKRNQGYHHGQSLSKRSITHFPYKKRHTKSNSPYGGIVHVRYKGRSRASSQPFGSPDFLGIIHRKNTPVKVLIFGIKGCII